MLSFERLKELKAEFEQVRKYNDRRCMSTVTEDDVIEVLDEAIARQSVKSEDVAISKTETTSCEWCEIASACEYEVTFFRDDDRWATERSLMPKFCPNCGRRLACPK